MEDLPIIQRRIVKRCLRIGRPVITATHMLESMTQNPAPTRAEVTDVANAVFEQSDAIMLSGETSVGKYPIECVKVFDRVSRRIERSGGLGYANDAILHDDRQKTVRSAVVLANSLLDSKILVFTRRGIMADCVSNLRPTFAPIYAFAETPEICRKLTLNWGVEPVLLSFEPDASRTVAKAQQYLLDQSLVKTGDHLVIVSDMLAGAERFDVIQLRIVGKDSEDVME